jgi:hypothetical protein
MTKSCQTQVVVIKIAWCNVQQLGQSMLFCMDKENFKNANPMKGQNNERGKNNN